MGVSRESRRGRLPLTRSPSGFAGRLAWFVALWAAGVLALAAVALVLRWAIGAEALELAESLLEAVEIAARQIVGLQRNLVALEPPLERAEMLVQPFEIPFT